MRSCRQTLFWNILDSLSSNWFEGTQSFWINFLACSSIFQMDFDSLLESIISVGLMIGAVFQLVCIGAALFLPTPKVDSAVNNLTNRNVDKPKRNQAETNVHEVDNVENCKTKSSSTLKQRKASVDRDPSRLANNLNKATKKNEKKKKRWSLRLGISLYSLRSLTVLFLNLLYTFSFPYVWIFHLFNVFWIPSHKTFFIVAV